MTNLQAVITIVIISLATLLTRFLPFIIFPSDRERPQVIRYLGRVLPGALLAFLVVYSFKGVFDYDRLKARLTAETYEFKLEKEKGLHIPKQEVQRTSMAIAGVIRTNLEAIPSRYTAAFIALAESFSGYQFSNEEKTELRNRLKDVAPQVMLSIQTEIRNLADDE